MDNKIFRGYEGDHDIQELKKYATHKMSELSIFLKKMKHALGKMN